MSTIFMNSENSNTSDARVLRLNITDKIDLQSGDKRVALSDLSIYSTWKNIKSFYRNNKCKISGTKWGEEIEVLYASYSVPDIQDYFKQIIKKHETLVDKPPVHICVNEIQNSVIFQIKAGYYLELLTPETVKLLGSTEDKINKDKNDENVPQLEIRNYYYY